MTTQDAERRDRTTLTSQPDEEQGPTGTVAVTKNLANLVAKERADQEEKAIHTMRTLRDRITRSSRRAKK